MRVGACASSLLFQRVMRICRHFLLHCVTVRSQDMQKQHGEWKPRFERIKTSQMLRAAIWVLTASAKVCQVLNLFSIIQSRQWPYGAACFWKAAILKKSVVQLNCV